MIDLLQRAARSSEPAAIRADLEAALRAGGDQLWVARNVARLYRERLDDRAAAAAVLDALAPLTCSEWRLVAAAWVELGDLERARECLEAGVANARIAADMCIIAAGNHEAGYADEARLLVDGAALVASRAIDHWIVANTYRDTFGERALAVATLERGQRDAVAVAEIVTFAHAFATFDVDREILAAQLARAARHASTVRDWLEVATAHHLLLLDEDAAIRCVDQASDLALGPDDEREIAIARGRVQLELLDDDRPKLPPGKLLRTGARAFAWPRDPALLLGWLRARIPRTRIDALTRPSQFFVNDDLVALLEIQKTGHVPHPLPAYLDILHAESRRTGDDVDHQTRAFACTLLCIEDAARAVPEGVEATIATLVESCVALGPDAVAGAAALFAAMADAYDATQHTTKQGYLVLFAELALVLTAAWLDPTDPRLAPTIARIVADEPAWRTRDDAPWLLGLARDDTAAWRRLAAQLLVHPALVPLAARLAP